jgi:hypothetical protein
MKKTFTKKERLAIYKRLLKQVEKPIKTRWSINYYLCWKLLAEIIGKKELSYLNEFTDENKEMVGKNFPEFHNFLGDETHLNTEERIELLNKCIVECSELKQTK